MGTIADPIANAMLDAVARAVPFSVAALWLQLHIGDPGPAGTANPAANTTRIQVTFGAAASSRSIANTLAVSWASVPATETYTHGTVWSAAVAGSLIGMDDLPAPVPVVIGDTAQVPVGAVVLTL